MKKATSKTTKGTEASGDLPKLSNPARRALAGAGCTRLEQVSKLTESDVKQLHGIGPNAIKELRRALKAKGLSFKPERKA